MISRPLCPEGRDGGGVLLIEESCAFWTVAERRPRRLSLFGEMDLSSVRVVDDALHFADAASGDLEVALNGITFLDAAGIGCLVRLFHQQRQAGFALRVTGVNSRTRRVVALTRPVWSLNACTAKGGPPPSRTPRVLSLTDGLTIEAALDGLAGRQPPRRDDQGSADNRPG